LLVESIDAALAEQMASGIGAGFEEEPAEKEEDNKKKIFWYRMPKWLRVMVICFCSFLVVLALIFGTRPGRRLVYGMIANYVHSRMQQPSPVITPEVSVTGAVLQPTQPVVDPSDIDDPTPTINPAATPILVTPAPIGEPRHEDYCYNILLIGEETRNGGTRSDSMILISVNQKDKKIHMVSLLRDMYVQIQGYADAKLNAAFAYGGAPLLVDTVERNLQVKIDGYVSVSFDSFEWIIDRLGGVEVTLSATEANYLNTTNYITKKQYRNVVAGTQLMNGNQALGYCRVRKVPNINGTDSDFGRTERQRMVLTQLFNKYREYSVFTLLGIMNDCLPLVTTNISAKDMSTLLEMVVEERILSLNQMRIPISGSYEDVRVGGVGEVLVVKWQNNIDALYKFIFGDEQVE